MTRPESSSTTPLAPEETLLVSNVEFYTPDDECAAVTLCSTSAEIIAFCWPCELHAGEIIKNLIYALDGSVRAAYLSDWPEDEKIKRARQRLEKFGPYAYRGCGQVLDRDAGLIEVFGFHIEIGEIPCEGPVEFECSRLSV